MRSVAECFWCQAFGQQSLFFMQWHTLLAVWLPTAWRLPNITMCKSDIEKMAYACMEGLLNFTQYPCLEKDVLDLLMMGLTWKEVFIPLDDIVFDPDLYIFLRFFNIWVRQTWSMRQVKCIFDFDPITYLGPCCWPNWCLVWPWEGRGNQKMYNSCDLQGCHSFLGLLRYYHQFVNVHHLLGRPISHYIQPSWQQLLS